MLRRHALLVARGAYADRGQAIAAELQRHLGSDGVRSSEWLYYDLATVGD